MGPRMLPGEGLASSKAIGPIRVNVSMALAQSSLLASCIVCEGEWSVGIHSIIEFVLYVCT